MSATATKERVDVYKVITDRIVQQLEKGVIPWQKPWKTVGQPKNLVSKKSYRGINPFILMSGSYSSPWWVSFKQAKELGGRVKAGEHGWPVVFWTRVTKKAKEGEEEGGTFALLRYYTVFNVEQTTGLEAKIPPGPVLVEHSPIEACEKIVAEMPKRPTIEHGGDVASYSMFPDRVNMPNMDRFSAPEAYYKTLFHELAHSTGAASRLDRFKDDTTQAHFGSQSYSQEELVAEMTAAFLCGVAGVEGAIMENSAAYIGGWLLRLKNDRKLVVLAGAQAQKAADFIRNVKWEEKTDEND